MSMEEQGSLCIELVLQTHGILFWEQHDHQLIGGYRKMFFLLPIMYTLEWRPRFMLSSSVLLSAYVWNHATVRPRPCSSSRKQSRLSQSLYGTSYRSVTNDHTACTSPADGLTVNVWAGLCLLPDPSGLWRDSVLLGSCMGLDRSLSSFPRLPCSLALGSSSFKSVMVGGVLFTAQISLTVPPSSDSSASQFYSQVA